MDDGDLTKLKDMRGYNEDFCKWTIYSVCMGLRALHEKHILHRDIKAENILHRSNGEIKLADLGLSVFLTEQEALRASIKGSTAFFSPEIAQGIFYGKEVDIWAFGCFAYELAMGKVPFSGSGEAGLIDAILDKNRPAPPLGDEWSQDFRDLVSRCLDKNRDTRITIE